jgi:Tfp pilus assembly protein PilN
LIASTNLAKRPFRNERLPWLLAGAVALSGLVVTIVHARVINQVVSGNEARTVVAVRADEARIAELEGDISREPPLRLDNAELARFRAYKELVDLRVFPWRSFLAELERVLSADVRLTRISPAGPKGGEGMLIEISGAARSKDAAFSVAEALDASPVFSSAVLKSLSENEGETEFTLEVVFDPRLAQKPQEAR